MRGFVPFLIMIASGAISAVILSAIVGLPIGAVCIGYALGSFTVLLGAIIVNSCNAARYGREVWEEAQHSDFDEPDEIASRRVRVRRGRGRGFHETPFSGSEASVRDE
jgi:hypothetical protein